MIKNKKVTVIAECGINHNGSLNKALEMIDVAEACGADIVKFQYYNTNKLVKKDAKLANYQKINSPRDNSQYELLKRNEISPSQMKEIFKYTKNKSLELLVTPFDWESFEFLLELGVKKVKISSGDLTNWPFLFEIAKKKISMIVSTGMATSREISQALMLIREGFRIGRKSEMPRLQNVNKAVDFELLKKKVALLHCTSDYPAPPSSLNLRAIRTLISKFGLKTGYSDHTIGIHASVAAVSLGAEIIEKHFTLDRNLPGPDHRASLEPDELKKMIENIRDIQVALGNGIKKPSSEELNVAKIVRKGLYAAKKIDRGTLIDKDSLVILRPENGSSLLQYWEKINRKAKKNYNIGDPV